MEAHVAEENAAPEPVVVEKPAKQSNMGLILAVVLVSLISSGGGAVLTAHLVGKAIASLPVAGAVPGEGHDGEAKTDEELAEAIEHSAVVPLEPFVVNLADLESARYLRIKVSLMVDDKSKVKEVIENQALTMKVRDVILQTLTRKTSQDLINEEGKNKLRSEIQEEIGHYFKEPKLTDVMFTEFVIQL
jgi:flagellar FliL protein